MHYAISDFVNKWADLLKPTNIQWILGNEGEKEHLLQAIRSRNKIKLLCCLLGPLHPAVTALYTRFAFQFGANIFIIL